MEDLPDLSGQKIRNYDVLRELNRGSLGVVYLVRHQTENQEYAMKILYPSEKNAVRFAQEKAAFEILSTEPSCSDRVVCLKEAFIHTIEIETEGVVVDRIEYYVLVLELMTSDLFTLFYRELYELPNRLLLVGLMLDLLEGLVEIHAKGMAHNDIKLPNLFYKNYRPEETMEVKYGDLGFACTDEIHRPRLKESLLLCVYTRGSPFYFSPEQAQAWIEQRGREEIFLKAAQKNDVWALGVVFRLLATNTYPFRSLTEMSHDPTFREKEHWGRIIAVIAREDLDPFEYDSDDPVWDGILSNIILSMTQQDPEDRPTASQALQEFLVWLDFGGYLKEGALS